MSARHAASRFSASHVGELLARKLGRSAQLTDADREALETLPFTLRNCERDQVIAHPGDAPGDLFLVLGGFAARAKMTRWGERQIVAFLLPGDLFDWPLFLLNAHAVERDRLALDHTILALTDCTIASLRPGSVLDLISARPAIARAFEANAVIEQDISREWLVNIGSRPAAERVAHLLCELFHRMRAVGLTNDHSCHLPLTQTHLSDSQGLSIVHTNRVLQRMRAEELIELSSRTLTLLDIERLEAFGDFSPGYLSAN